ncbi:hypothetical protein [Promicromonospora panici]|uniref:hypothetical protein n=1 Tax=Promicromonospora panici TaxID=2219658 RepID=UPI00101D9D15|nr:hypothetical protein [Promicromonospora panici]
MTRKTLYLHVGMGKTGTSALQVAFVRNRKQLAAHGIAYPEHPSDVSARRGEVVSGNAMGLVRYLDPRTRADIERKERFLAGLERAIYNAPQPRVLFSSEFLYSANHERFGSFCRDLLDKGIGVEVVVYVRDIAGHALSLYSQVVKRSLFTGAFMDFITPGKGIRYAPSIRGRLHRMLTLVGRERLHVMHYDSDRDHLMESFMRNVFGIEGIDEYDLTHGQVNRSLTDHEIELMRYMNGRLRDTSGAGVVNQVIIRRPPLKERKPSMTEEQLSLLEKRFLPDVEWVNETFFESDLLTVQGDTPVTDSHRTVAPISAEEKFLLDCLSDLANGGPEIGVA